MRYTTLMIIVGMFLFGCQPQKKTSDNSFLKGDERFRPQYHFYPDSAWMNDPNGMVFYEGEYHLFYQYYPDSNVWGPMHWGHAVSNDLVSWEHLPIALYPDSLGYIFSGSAVIDRNNTSGLGSENNPPMVAIYTYHDPVGAEEGKINYQTQGIAYSLDKGRTWTKYENNPVLNNPGIEDFRDPKVSWDEEFQQWTMALAVKDHIRFYASTNLIDWELQSEFGKNIGAHGGVWECPDLFKLESETGEEKWVLLVSINPGGPKGGSATQYFVGDFDGKTFIPDDTVTKWIDHGTDNYAGVTWSNIPDEDGRTLFIGWMSNWDYGQIVPTYAWRSAMTLPRELRLLEIGGDFYVQSKPVREIDQLFDDGIAIRSGDSIPDKGIKLEVENIPNDEIELSFVNEYEEKLMIKLTEESLIIDRSKAGITDFHKEFAAIHQTPLMGVKPESISIYLDRSSVEVFLNDGEIVMTDLIFPSHPYSSLLIPTGDADVMLHSLLVN